MVKREYAVVEAGCLRPFTEQDCKVQRGSKELKLALDEAAELWEGSKTKRKRQQETAVKADIEPPAKKSKRKAVTATRPGELVFFTDDYDTGSPIEVLEENGHWKECTLYRHLPEGSSRVVLWFEGDEYEGLDDPGYTMDEEGAIHDGDGDEILTRSRRPQTRSQTPFDRNSSINQETKKSKSKPNLIEGDIVEVRLTLLHRTLQPYNRNGWIHRCYVLTKPTVLRALIDGDLLRLTRY